MITIAITVHSTRFIPRRAGVAIDVADQQQIAGEYGSGQNTKKSSDSRRWRISLTRHKGREENLRSHKAEAASTLGPFGNETHLLRKLSSYFASHLHMDSPFNPHPRDAPFCVGQVNPASQKKQAGGERWRKPKNHEAHLPNWT